MGGARAGAEPGRVFWSGASSAASPLLWVPGCGGQWAGVLSYGTGDEGACLNSYRVLRG